MYIVYISIAVREHSIIYNSFKNVTEVILCIEIFKIKINLQYIE